jgi:hypothetical protein
MVAGAVREMEAQVVRRLHGFTRRVVQKRLNVEIRNSFLIRPEREETVAMEETVVTAEAELAESPTESTASRVTSRKSARSSFAGAETLLVAMAVGMVIPVSVEHRKTSKDVSRAT